MPVPILCAIALPWASETSRPDLMSQTRTATERRGHVTRTRQVHFLSDENGWYWSPAERHLKGGVHNGQVDAADNEAAEGPAYNFVPDELSVRKRRS